MLVIMLHNKLRFFFIFKRVLKVVSNLCCQTVYYDNLSLRIEQRNSLNSLAVEFKISFYSLLIPF